MKEKVLCTICARGGSKGVKNKNIREIAGKPLIAYTIEQAISSKLFEHIVVSTDSDDIIDVARQYGAECFFKRSEVLASDTAGKLQVVQDAFRRSEAHYETQFGYLVDLDATAPLRNVDDIINATKLCINEGYSNVITATESRRSPYFNMVEKQEGKVRLAKVTSSGQVFRRQDAPPTYDMNASIYVWDRETILLEEKIFLDKTGLYIMPEERSLDIDTPLDFDIVSFLLENRSNKC